MNSLLLIVLLLIAFGALGGGFYTNAEGLTPYRTGGWSIGGILVVILIILLVMGRI